MINKKKIMIYTVVLLSIVTLLFIGTTFAYYGTLIQGNTSEQSLSVTSGTVGVKYNDNNASIITGSEITPGYIATKTFSVSNTGDSNVYFNIILDNVTNGFNKGIEERGEYNDWVYRLYSGSTKNEDNLIKKGEITTASLQVLESNLEVKTGETNEYYLEIEYLYRQYINQSADMGASLSLRVNIEEFTLDNPYSEGTLAYTILNSAAKGENGTKYIDASMLGIAENTSIPAEEASLATESIISFTYDDYTATTGIPSYYFRGNVVNNYVNFAGMCFRILRIDGNGNIKLILEDKDTTCNSSTFVGNWNIGSGNFGYNGSYSHKLNYLNPEVNNASSMVKAFYDFQYLLNTKVASVYQNKEIKDYLSVGNWCLNDIAYSTSNIDQSIAIPLTKEEKDDFYLHETFFYYDSWVRLYGNKDSYGYSPTLKCNGTILDKFMNVPEDNPIITTETYMYIGAITADEIVYAGGKYSTSPYKYNYYLSNDYQKTNSISFWSLSPARYEPSSFGRWSDEVFIVYATDKLSMWTYGLDNDYVYANNAFRPALSLISGVTLDSTIEGQNGTQEHPYVIS